VSKRVLELLLDLREETANEISELEQSDEIDAWLLEQSMPTAAYAKDLATVVRHMDQELSCRGLSLRIH
jgi:hypothetical protein